MNRKILKHEWGAVTFIGTVVLGGLAVLVALLIKAIGPSTAAVSPPCPRVTPIVVPANASPPALPSVPFGCPEPSIVVQTPSPSPSASPAPSPTASPSATASPSSSPSAKAS